MNLISEITSPNICIICRQPCIPIARYPGFCHVCLQQLPWRLNRCYIEIDDSFYNQPEFYNKPAKPRVYAACDYEGRLRRSLIEFKFYGRTGMSRPLASILAQTVRNLKLHVDAVAAVPLHRSRLRERGYNQAGLLAAYTSEMINCSDISDLLIRVKQTGRQSEQFSRAARFDNLQDAFALDLTNCRNIANLLRNRRILLIDDVLTTGATMLEAAKPLMSEGAEVYCLAVASDHA